MERGLTLTEGDVEDFVLPKIAERGGEADPARETMHVDAQKAWAQPILKLLVLQLD